MVCLSFSECKFLQARIRQSECVELISTCKFCFGDSSNKTEFDTREPLLALWSRLAMVTICFAVKKQTLKALFPSATCGCERAVSGKGRIVDGFCWFIPHAHTHNPCHCVLHPRRDTGNSQVPACFTEKCSNRKFHKMLQSWLEPSGWRLQSFSLLFHRPHSRFSSTTVVSDIISEPAGKLFCYTCERVRTPSGSSHTPNLFKVAFTCPQLVRVLKAYNKSGLQS